MVATCMSTAVKNARKRAYQKIANLVSSVPEYLAVSFSICDSSATQRGCTHSLRELHDMQAKPNRGRHSSSGGAHSSFSFPVALWEIWATSNMMELKFLCKPLICS